MYCITHGRVIYIYIYIQGTCTIFIIIFVFNLKKNPFSSCFVPWWNNSWLKKFCKIVYTFHPKPIQMEYVYVYTCNRKRSVPSLTVFKIAFAGVEDLATVLNYQYQFLNNVYIATTFNYLHRAYQLAFIRSQNLKQWLHSCISDLSWTYILIFKSNVDSSTTVYIGSNIVLNQSHLRSQILVYLLIIYNGW